MKLKLSKTITTLAASAFAMAGSHAATVFSGTFDLSGDGNNVSTFAYNGAAIPNVTVSALAKVGITSTSSNNNFRGSNWPLGATDGSDTFTGTIDLGNYIEFTLTAAPGYTIDMTSITFGVGRSGTGPRQWQWGSSATSYSAITTYTTLNSGLTNTSGVLTNPDTNSSWTGNVLDLSGSTHKDLSSVTFRLYGFNAEQVGGTGGLQGNLSFAGTAIPEPAAGLLGGLGMIVLLRRRRMG